MTINLQSAFMKKTRGCQMKEKELMLESISMVGTSRRLFKPCHQAPLKEK